jgi:hypothetical protein
MKIKFKTNKRKNTFDAKHEKSNQNAEIESKKENNPKHQENEAKM